MYWNAVPGRTLEVYSIDGHLVGTDADAWPETHTSTRRLARTIGEPGEGYFQLTGFKGGDLYVPFSALADFSDERIRLNLTRKQLAAQGWHEPPAHLPERGRGAEGGGRRAEGRG